MKLRISSIDSSLPKDKLQSLFSEYGEIESLKIFRGVGNESPTCIGFVVMGSLAAAEDVMENLNGVQVGDFKINVELSNDTVRVKKPLWKPISLDEDENDLSSELMYETNMDDNPFDEDF